MKLSPKVFLTCPLVNSPSGIKLVPRQVWMTKKDALRFRLLSTKPQTPKRPLPWALGKGEDVEFRSGALSLWSANNWWMLLETFVCTVSLRQISVRYEGCGLEKWNGDELIERTESDTFLKKWVQYERFLCDSLAPRTPTQSNKTYGADFAQYYHMWLPVNNNSQVGSPLQIWKSFNSICRLALHGIRSKIYPTFGVKRRSVASLVICNGFYISYKAGCYSHPSILPLRPFPFTKSKELSQNL